MVTKTDRRLGYSDEQRSPVATGWHDTGTVQIGAFRHAQSAKFDAG
jgi:hypothetical protein